MTYGYTYRRRRRRPHIAGRTRVNNRSAGVANGIRNSCVAITCARCMAPTQDPIDVRKALDKVLEMLPVKPRGRGGIGMTPKGAWYGGVNKAMDICGITYKVERLLNWETGGKLTVRQLLRRHPEIGRAVISVRNHSGFIDHGSVYDLSARQRVKWVYILD